MSDGIPLLSKDYHRESGGSYDTYQIINNSHVAGQITMTNLGDQNTTTTTTTTTTNTHHQQQQQQQDESSNSIEYQVLADGKLTNRHSKYAAVPVEPPTAEDLGITAQTSKLEAKHTIQNHMFGFRPFKSKIIKKKVHTSTKNLYVDNPVITKGVSSVGNYFYAIFFGAPVAFFFCLTAAILACTVIALPYARVIWSLKGFVLWPFGKYYQITAPSLASNLSMGGERQPLRRGSLDTSQPPTMALRIGLVVYYILGAPILIVVQGLVLIFCWMIVVMIPTAKMHTKILLSLLRHPLSVRVEEYTPRSDCQILLYPVEAINVYYYKFTVAGMNVVLVNLLPFVILSLVFGYFLDHLVHPMVMFLCCIMSTIPLSYYNGMAIASLSAQTSFAIGALINTSFGSIIELILYVVTLYKHQEDVVRSALTGALLGSVLLIPGLSMVVGGLKHKEQKFNPTVMGVSTVLMMVAVIGAFAPTIFYKIYGDYTLTCSGCITIDGVMNCGKCGYTQIDLDDDPVYTTKARNLMYIISGVLPVAYFIGLLFTLKTHTHILYPNEGGKGHGHGHGGDSEDGDSSMWGKKECIFVLCVCTTMFALVSEKLVESIDPVSQTLGLSHSFLGLTVLGVVPAIGEYINAIQFALHNNMPLALEIGASTAVQIILFQMPVLVFISAVMNHLRNAGSFTLIFPLMDFFAVFFGVVVMNLVFNNGKTNYFIGSTLYPPDLVENKS
eukprot:gene8921-10453_t